MSLAGVKKKWKKCYQIWFWRLLAFVTDFAIVLAINRMCSANLFCFQNKALKIVFCCVFKKMDEKPDKTWISFI
jgi:hypothetical protein